MYTTAAFFIINQTYERVILHEKPDLKYTYKYRCIQNASTKIMHIFCIECLPQNFTSADQTENYDLDDSVAYGEKITATSKNFCATYFTVCWNSTESEKES